MLDLPLSFLAGGGEMAKAIVAKDWSVTPLGPLEGWPQSLRTTVSLCLASNFPISIAWGDDRVQIYNDGYWPICGGKHPHSMGQDFKECWFSAWPEIGEAFERAQAGEATYIEDQRMFLDRNGYLEETFFTFSFSPIRDESGRVGGLFHPVTETTRRMLSERRTRALRDLTARATKAESIEQACSIATEVLAEYSLDLPFVLLYVFNEEGSQARLVAATGIDPNTPASPSVVEVGSAAMAWPILQPIDSSEPLLIENLSERFQLSCGPYPEPPKAAFVAPIPRPGMNRAAALLIAGVSSRLPLDEPYRAFFDLLTSYLATAIANARADEEERRRAEALAELDRAKSTFFTNVSHEFRTPLTLILGPIEEMLSGSASGSTITAPRGDVEMMQRSTRRLLRLVNALLDFSRIEAGRVRASYEPVDLASFTKDVASVFRSAVERVGLRFLVDCPPLPERVYVDPSMWEKVVLNLISNALKFTFDGEIQVALKHLGPTLEFSVRDTGTGIPESELPHIFERFHRVEGAQGRSFEGTGIGLALVRELILLQGGSVRVESAAGRGSRFTVSLPYGPAPLPEEQIETQTTARPASNTAVALVEEALHWSPAAVGPEPDANETMVCSEEEPITASQQKCRARVLLADDNADMREYVCRLLAHRFDVEAVANGKEALRVAERRVPDLVLADVMMPGLDGFALLRELRQNPRTAAIPVILLSARAGEESRIDGLAAGADDYVVKPFGARELMARVEASIELARLRQEVLIKEEERRADAHATRVLRESEARLWEVNQQLLEANRELEEFAYVASHDLQEPLRTVNAHTQLMLSRFAEGQHEQAGISAGYVRAGVARMQMLIKDLFTYSRTIHEDKSLLVPVPLSGSLKQALDGLRTLIDDTGAEITAGELPTVKGDATQLTQVFQNLLSNALKYSKPDRALRIHVSAERWARSWVISVRDNGIGFEQKHADRIFELFKRLHRDEYPGTGLGLAICKRNAGAPGWAHLGVEPARRRLDFLFLDAGRGPMTGDIHIFLAEDNGADVYLVNEALRFHGLSYQLQVAADCEEAASFLENVAKTEFAPCPNVVLLDLNLPKGSGHELLAAFRSHPICTRVPVVVVTSSDARADRIAAAELGAARYFRKPSDLNEFMQLGAIVKELAGMPKKV